jgi:hypothetical protein
LAVANAVSCGGVYFDRSLYPKPNTKPPKGKRQVVDDKDINHVVKGTGGADGAGGDFIF